MLTSRDAASAALHEGYVERRPSLGEALLRFLEDITIEGRSSHTVKSYRSLLRYFLDDPRPIDVLTASLCRSLIAEKMGGTRSTARTFAGALSSFCRFISTEYGTERVTFPTPRAILPPHRFLSHADIQKLWTACPNNRYRVMLLLLLEGVRASEAVGLRWRDVSGDVAQIRGKGAKYRRVVLSPRLMAYLDSEPHRGELVLGYGYNGLRHRVQRLGRLAGIPHCHPHLLRHSFASNALVEGMDSETLRNLGGWAPGSAMLNRYTRSVQEQAAIQRSREFGLVERLIDGGKPL